MVSYIDIDGLVSTTHNTVNRLFEYKNGGDALMLYFRYIQQRKQQQNNQTYSADIFMIKATGWGRDKFYKVKKILVDLKFIETIQRFDEQGKMAGSYVKVNFIIETNPSFDIDAVVKNRSPWITESVKQDTNTLVSKVNTLVEKENTPDNKKILETYRDKNQAGTTRFSFYQFLLFLESENRLTTSLDESKMQAIETKLADYRTKLGDQKAKLELESFIDHHTESEVKFSSVIGRLNTWLSNKI